MNIAQSFLVTCRVKGAIVDIADPAFRVNNNRRFCGALVKAECSVHKDKKINCKCRGDRCTFRQNRCSLKVGRGFGKKKQK